MFSNFVLCIACPLFKYLPMFKFVSKHPQTIGTGCLLAQKPTCVRPVTAKSRNVYGVNNTFTKTTKIKHNVVEYFPKNLFTICTPHAIETCRQTSQMQMSGNFGQRTIQVAISDCWTRGTKHTHTQFTQFGFTTGHTATEPSVEPLT